MTNPYRSLPAVDRLMADPRVGDLTRRLGHEPVTTLARAMLDGERRRITERAGAAAAFGELVDELLRRGADLERSLLPVINATGVLVHTNLGRAPLARSAVEAMRAATEGYSTLEYAVATGERGSRQAHASGLLCRVTGAESGLVVNNNAAALLLALAALCSRREAVIARGQLVEIGGGFRIPDVMRQSGASLVEVGTTNRTHIADYEAALGPETGAIVRVHSSNFKVVGFTAEASVQGLGELARRSGVRLIDDVGSGALLDTRDYGLAAEPLVQDSVRAGADVVLFSGDKLLGGPQAGIAVGRADAIGAMASHPLARAVRIDKASLAALIATLEHYQRGDAQSEIPIWQMLSIPAEELERRAGGWASACGTHGQTISGHSTVGGGSLPGQELSTTLCAVSPPAGAADLLAERLRSGAQPIVGRIQGGLFLLDPRTVPPSADEQVAAALAGVLGNPELGRARGQSGDTGTSPLAASGEGSPAGR